ncbi:MAG: DSD1 family PLP-dependent enzyme [Pseudomonadota bacterium]
MADGTSPLRLDLLAIETPALIVDLDALDRNIARMAREAADLGVRLRPHAKTHKCAGIARMQVQAGAVGITCQKLGEAEAMVAGGIEDVLVTNEIVAPAKLERLAALAHRAKVGFCVDALEPAKAASAVAVAAGVELGVLVEIDVGAGRCGTTPGADAAALARAVADLPGLRFDGLQAYHGGAQQIRDPEGRAGAIRQAAALVEETLAALSAEGLSAYTIGGAGTGSYPFESGLGPWNEIQPGSYIFMDASYAQNTPEAGYPAYEHSLFLLTTVMSRRDGGHAVLDAGHKATAIDSGMPRVVGIPGAEVTGLSDEHTVVALAEGELALGTPVLLMPGHCDPTVNLHDRLIGVRGLGTPQAEITTILSIDARGALL